jgi:hypothetical protein
LAVDHAVKSQSSERISESEAVVVLTAPSTNASEARILGGTNMNLHVN